MVYVSSYHIVSSLGAYLNENLEKIKLNVTGISLNNDLYLTPIPTFIAQYDHNVIDDYFKRSNTDNHYSKYEKLSIFSIDQALKNSNVNPSTEDTVIILSTTKGNIDLIQPSLFNLFEHDRCMLWKSSDLINNYFNSKNKPITISNACISGTLAILIAQRLLESGRYKNAIVSGADILPEFTLSGFQAFKAVADSPCKPFDKNRNGMTPGEGAGTIILTTDPKFASKPEIIFAGGASGNDANHISGPSKTGEEPAGTIKKAFTDAGLSSADIDYISAHGTATLYNDESEAKAFSICGLTNTPANSFKGYLGHTFGAAGIIETILSIESIKQGLLFKSVGFFEQGTDEKLNIITENYRSELKHVLKTASGFGGSNAAIVFGKENRSKKSTSNVHFKVLKKVQLTKNNLYIDDLLQKNPSPESGYNSINDFLKALYKQLNIQYPKFFKMDVLCKTAFVSCEYLLKENNPLHNVSPEDIAVILSNGSASLNTDADYQLTINNRDNYFPAPSLFVYTLPNIMAGEICIRHKITGENSVFISENFDKDFIFDYVKLLFQNQNAKIAIAGRIDHSYPDGNIFSELYLLENSK